MANKYFVRGLSDVWNAYDSSTKAQYNDSLVFLTDTHEIIQNGITFGFSSTDAARLDSVITKSNATKYISAITGNSGSVEGVNTGKSLGVKGSTGITTTVDTNGVTIKHTNAITAGTASGTASSTLTFGGSFTVPTITYDAQGHITAKGTTTLKLPANPNTDTHYQATAVFSTTATGKDAAATTNAATYLNLVENSTVRSSHQIIGSGKVSVAVDTAGKLTITGAGVTAATGDANGQIKIDGTNIAVKGLGTAAYTASTAYVPTSRTVNGKALSANISLTKADVELGNVTNESKATMFTSPAFTGTPTAPTAAAGTNTTQVATTAFVNATIDSKIAAADAMIYKGTLGTGGTITAVPTTYKTGYTYKVITAGTYAGIKCEVGDMLIALEDSTGTATNSHWTVVQNNIDGAVTGPTSSGDGRIATFSGTTGKIIKDSGYTIASFLTNTTKYAASASVGGSATSAVKLDTATAGSATQPVYFSGGKPVATTYTLGASVPSGAKFTDTTYTAATTSAAGLMSAADKTKLDGIAASANAYTLPTATSSVLGGIKIGYASSGKNYAVQLSNGQAYVNVPWTDNNTTYSNMKAATADTSGAAGLVPMPGAGKQTSFLRGDGTWVVPTNTTYSVMTAATASAAGKQGLVPAPAAGAQTKFLRGDGTWQTTPNTNTTYTFAGGTGAFTVTPSGGTAQTVSIGKPSTAGTADQVKTVLTVQFNGTTNATFNGSAAKTVNITPAAIGAVPVSDLAWVELSAAK